MLLAAVVLLLRVIRPRLNDRDPIPGSWVHATHTDPAELLAYYRTAVADHQIATEVCGLARITRAKYKRTARAITVLVTGLLVLAAALLLAFLIR